MLLKVASCYKVFLGFRPVYIVAQIERTKRTNYFFFAFLTQTEYDIRSIIMRV